MSNFSRVSPKFFLTLGVLGGALLLAPSASHAQDAAPNPTTPAASTTAWTTFKGDPQRTGSSAAATKLPLSLQWRFSSIGSAHSYITSPLVIGAPGNQIVVFAADNVVYATDVNTGAQVWKSPELASSISVPLTLLSTDDGDLILALQSSGRLAAIKTADGGRAWEVDCGALATEAGPIIVKTKKGPRIICALNTGRLVAVTFAGVIDKDWQLQIGAIGTSAASSMAVMPDNSRMFIMGSDSRLYIINVPEARVLFSLPQATRSSITPIATNDAIYTASGKRLSSLRIGDGGANWTLTADDDIVASPSLMQPADGSKQGALIFFGTRGGKFSAVDAAKGTIKWEKTLTDTPSITGSPLVLKNVVLVGTSTGALVGFNPTSGDILWQYSLGTERVYDLKSARERENSTFGGGRFGGGRGGRGGGGFGGRGGGGFGGTGRNSEPEKRTYGVSSAPAAIDNHVFVLGDDAALYGFTSLPFDADPPRIIEPSIAVNATDRNLLALLLKPDSPQIVPGIGPFYFAAQIDDVGSGIDPSSVTVSINDKPLEAARVFYGQASGVLTATLVDPAKNDPALTDGLKKVVISAKDYAGNVTSFSTSFLVDNTTPAPAAPTTYRNGSRGGRNGGRNGGRGGNFGGGDPNGGDPNGGGFDGGDPNGGGFDGGDPNGGGFDGGGFDGGRNFGE